MSKLKLPIGQSFYNSPVEQCYYCERHLSGYNTWTNLERCNDLLRPSTKVCGDKIRVITCHTCNRAKARLEPEEFIERLQEYLAKQQEFYHIQVLLIEKIIKNLQYILAELEPNLNGRNLTVIRKKNLKKPQLKYQTMSNLPSIQAKASQLRGLTCYYCNRPLDTSRKYSDRQITRDHVRPISKHPKSKQIVFSCQLCNNSKANDEPEIFLAKLKIAHYHEQNYKKIPYHLLSTIIANLSDLIHKSLKSFAPYPVLDMLQLYDISLLRQELHKKKRQLWLDQVDDYVLLEMLLLCLGTQDKRSRDSLALDAAFFNMPCWENRLEFVLHLGWISTFYCIDTIDFHVITDDKEFDQFYILNDQGRTILQLGMTYI